MKSPHEDSPPTAPESHGRHARPANRRHAASGGLNYSPLAILMALSVLIVIIVVVLIVTLTGNSNSVAKKTSTGGSSAAGPSSAQAAALPELSCSGQSYLVTDDGQTQDQLLADPAA
ncbi:MAG: hypothetical protein ABI206_09825, partial [Antricoccus sp.]